MKWRNPVRAAAQLVRGVRTLEAQVAVLGERSQAMQARVDRIREETARDRATVHELRDSVHSVARRSAFGRDRTRVLFLVHLIEAWDSYHDVVRAMEAAADFEPIVVSIPRHFNGDATL